MKRTSPITVESLEPRRLMSGTTPTAQEQYVVELINRARLAPATEAARYHTALNEGLADGSITDAAKQPLALNSALIDSARGHSRWMLDNQTFSHTGEGVSSPDQRMTAAGYEMAPPYAWAENIAWQSQGEADAVSTPTLDAIHQNLYVDNSEPDRGHRLNMLEPNLKEIGVGAMTGDFIGYNAVMETEDYAFSGSQSFLTGVAYTDTVQADHFYTVGEGLGGIQITATRSSDGASFNTATWDAGGYTLALPAGTYTVQASGGALNGTVTRGGVVIGAENVKQDFNPLPVVTTDPGSGTGGSSGGTPSAGTPSKPKGALNRHKYGYTSANGHYFCFTVTYTGTAALDASSLGAMTVSGPNRFGGQALLASTQSMNGGNTLVAIYYVRRPRGSWGQRDLGLYTIKMPAKAVRDALGDTSDSASLGALRLVLST